jgi:DNA-binding transcriptional MerR regulator
MAPDETPRGLLIGDLAALTGLTTRAIRHYHAVALLPEPARDTSGYRRYGAADVVRATRVSRLRAPGMPIEQIAATLASGPAHADLPTALQALADDIGRQIDVLRETRERLLALAASGPADDPASDLAAALRAHGMVADGATLPAGERDAAALADALHPGGVDALLEQAGPQLVEPERAKRLRDALAAVRGLTDDADDETLDALARKLARVFPRPKNPAKGVDLTTMEQLIPLSPAHRRLMRRYRQLTEGGES